MPRAAPTDPTDLTSIKRRVNLNLEHDLIEEYKAFSVEIDVPYTSIMRDVLRRFLTVEKQVRAKQQASGDALMRKYEGAK